MDVDAPRGLLRAFAELEDPRMDRTKHHNLPDILAIAICSVVCGADGWTHMELFGQSKEKWFSTFLELPNGIPSHDTFRRVFNMLDPKAFENCFMAWIEQLAVASEGRLNTPRPERSTRATVGSSNERSGRQKMSVGSPNATSGPNFAA